MQQYLIEHRAQYIALGAVALNSGLNGFRDRTAQTAGGVRVLGQNLAANLGGRGRGRGNAAVKDAHDCLAEGLLLVGALDHEYVTGQIEVAARLAQRGAPLTGTGLGGHAGQTLLFSVVGLRDRRIELVRTGGIVALELVVDLCRGSQRLFQCVSTDKRGRTVHFIDFLDLFRDIDISMGLVQFLTSEFFAENRVEIALGHGLEGCRMQHRVGLFLHDRTQIEPLLGHLVFGQIQTMGNLGHVHTLLYKSVDCGKKA